MRTHTSDDYCLNLFRLIVGARACWKCEHCGHVGEDCNPHHIFSRENKSIRYDTINGAWLCNACHRFAENYKGLFIKSIQTKRGLDWWNELVRRKNIIVKWNDSFRFEWKEKLLSEVKEAA